MTEHEKLKALMRDLGLNFHDIARITEHSYQSVKTMLQPNKKLPRWMKLVLYVQERWQNKNGDNASQPEQSDEPA